MKFSKLVSKLPMVTVYCMCAIQLTGVLYRLVLVLGTVLWNSMNDEFFHSISDYLFSRTF